MNFAVQLFSTVFVGILIFGTSIFGSVSLANPNGTVWNVQTRSCGGKPQAPEAQEQFEFQSGLFVHSYIATATTDQYCIDAKSNHRTIRSKFEQGEVYTEASTLQLFGLRTFCFSKSDDKMISDVTREARSPLLSASFQVNSFNGTMGLVGDSKCSGGWQYQIRPAK